MQQVKNKINILENIDWEFREDKTDFATHNIHRYSSKYIPQIPEAIIRYTTSPGDVILDPFLGSGTTLLEANRLNRHSIGIDINPVALLISRTKTRPLDIKKIDVLIKNAVSVIAPKITSVRSFDNKQADLLVKVMGDIKYDLPSFKYASNWYQPIVLIELSIIKDYINQNIHDKKMLDFFACAFSAIVRSVSNAASGYGNLMIDKNKRKITNTFEIFESQLLKMRSAISELNIIHNPEISIKIFQGDSTNINFIEDKSIDSIITHPPYISAVPYAEYLRLSLLWLQDSFKDLFDRKYWDYLDYKKLDLALVGGKRNRSDVVERFNESMRLTIREMYRVLKKGKYCSIVIGNPVVRGQLIECNKTLTELAISEGFNFETSIRRGKYKTTMGKMKEEFILIFRK